MNANFKLLPEAVATVRLQNKGEVLARLAAIFGDVYGLDSVVALENLEEREALGSTGFGRKVALPHARSREVTSPSVVLLRLVNPVDFGAADGMPVDLVFGLLSPENAGASHLHALAALSRLVRDDAMHESLIEAPDDAALYSLLNTQIERDAA